MENLTPSLIHLPEEVGESSDDLGLKLYSVEDPKHYGVVLSTAEMLFSINRKTLPPEDIEQTMFGYPIEDKRQIIFADTHSYGIRPTDWAINYGSVNGNLIKKNDLPDTSKNELQNDLYPNFEGVWVSGTNNVTDFYGGIASYERYANSAIELVVNSKYVNGVPSTPFNVSCATKQVFDCDVAANIFVSFGIKREYAHFSCISQCGIFSSETGWYIEIENDGSGDNFRVVRRYTNSQGVVIDESYYRSSFVDKLDGTGESKHTIRFDYVTMFAIEIGSYDGSAVKFYAYIPDARAGNHAWVMFHKVNISDNLNLFPERNGSALPLTFSHASKLTSGISKLVKYGTSVTRVGATTSVIKMFSVAGQFKELIPFKPVFIFSILTKDLFNSKKNYTKHFPKYLTAASNVPVEILITRFKLTESNSQNIGLQPSAQQQTDVNNLLYVINPNGTISIISISSQVEILKIDVNAKNILYVQKYNILYAVLTNNSIAVIDGTSGDILNYFDIGGIALYDLAFISTTVSGAAQDRIIVTTVNGFTVYNITNSTTTPNLFLTPLPVYSTSLTGIPSTAQILAGDDRFFIATTNTVQIFSATTTGSSSALQTLSFDTGYNVLAIAYTQLRFFVSISDGFTNKVKFYNKSGTSYQSNQDYDFDVTAIFSPDILAISDGSRYIYVASTISQNYIKRDYYSRDFTGVVTFNLPVAMIVDIDLTVYLFDSGGLLTNANTQNVILDINSGSSFLKGSLIASGINPLIYETNYPLIGDSVASLIIGRGSKQINLTNVFQEYREFFSSTYDTFNNKLESQDLVLFYLKHVGELLSELNEQVNWILGTSNFTVVQTVTASNPQHIINLGSGTLSLITGQN